MGLPMDVDTERALLGSVLLEPVDVMAVARGKYRLRGEAFADPKHGVLFDLVCEMEAEGRLTRVDVITVCSVLEDRGKLEDVGGRGYVLELIDACVSPAMAEAYADIVRQKWMLRQGVLLARSVEAEALRAEQADVFLRGVPERFAGILGDVRDELSNRDVVELELDRWRRASAGEGPAIGLPLPWPKLTKLTCGLEDGLTLLAARPSVGKSTMEDDISTSLALDGLGVARVQLDMNRRKSLSRAVCRIAGVSLPKLKHGFARHDQLEKVREAADLVGALPMFVNDRDFSLRAICSWARVMKMKHDVKLLTVDHIQLVQVDAGLSRGANDNTKVAYVSSTLKALGAELGIPVLALSQLSRGSDRENRRPKLSDLRDSGTLEQDAAKVIFLYREFRVKTAEKVEMVGPGRTPRRAVWADVQKNQDGETGFLPMWLYPKYFRFEEIGASDHEEALKYEGDGPVEVDDEG